VRLYSTKTFKALGTLVYHKDALQALSFARARPGAARHHHQPYPGCGGEDNVVDDDCNDADEGNDEDEDDDDEMSGEEKARRSRWLVSGGKDGRVVVWGLMDFTAREDNDRRREH
jgi:hypothetical protein